MNGAVQAPIITRSLIRGVLAMSDNVQMLVFSDEAVDRALAFVRAERQVQQHAINE